MLNCSFFGGCSKKSTSPCYHHVSHLKEGAAVADVTLQSRTGGEVTRPKPDDLPRSSENELQRRLFDVGGKGKPHIYIYISVYIDLYILYII